MKLYGEGAWQGEATYHTQTKFTKFKLFKCSVKGKAVREGRAKRCEALCGRSKQHDGMADPLEEGAAMRMTVH
jgi:hypothetical protein